MPPRVIRSLVELIEALRERRESLNISMLTLDEISGLQSGYSGKVLAPRPVKNLGPMSFEMILGGLALGICQITIVEDQEAIERLRSRMVPRKRPQKAKAPVQAVNRGPPNA